MGWYYSGVSQCTQVLGTFNSRQNLMGPTFAPVFGGVFSQYTKVRGNSWRCR